MPVIETPGDRTVARHAAAAILVFAMACTAPVADAPQRIIEEIPADEFQLEQHAAVPVIGWTFDEEADLDAWTLRADLRAELDDSALWLASSDRSSLVRQVAVDAGDVDTLQVRLDGVTRGQPAVFWAAAGEAFSADRSIRLRPIDGVDGVYTFRLADRPDWGGEIRRLRIDVSNAPGELIGVRSIALTRVAGDLAADAFGRAWRFDVDNEVRAGFAVSATTPVSRSMAAATAGVVHFAYTLLAPPGQGEARFVVTRVAAGGRVEIFSRSVAGEPQWRTDSVPLPAGDAVELEFAIECPESSKCLGAFASIERHATAQPRQPNVVLISLDTLRADRMSLYGHERATTTNIDRWAGNTGVTFGQVVAQAPWTLPSHVSMLTGLNATTHGANHPLAAAAELVMLAERLRPLGYFTAAVTGGGYMSPDFGFWQGFDAYRYWTGAMTSLAQDDAVRELPDGVDGSIAMVDEAGDRPFFLLFHTYAIHSPYRPRQPYFDRYFDGDSPSPDLTVASERLPQEPQDGYRVTRRLYRQVPGGDMVPLGDDELELARAMYDAGVARADAEVGRLLEALDDRGLLDNTLIILTSDHGEMLGEEGLGGHAYLHDLNLMVPLVFSWPARFDGGRRVDSQVRSVDIVPTVLELLGHDTAAETFDGVSLLPFIEATLPTPQVPAAISYAAASNRGIALRVDNQFKYVYDNTLWRQGVIERMSRIGGPPAGNGSAEFGPAETAAARARVEEVLENRAGLHMVLRNSSNEGDMMARLQGSAVHLERLKATGLDCPCARWIDARTAEIRVRPGAVIGVQIESVEPGLLTVELADDDRSFSTVIDLAALDQPYAVDLVDDEFRPVDLRRSPVDQGLALWWQGDPRLTGTQSLDDDLRRNLRALGYLR